MGVVVAGIHNQIVHAICARRSGRGEMLREIAGKWLTADATLIVEALKEGVLQEAGYDEKEED